MIIRTHVYVTVSTTGYSPTGMKEDIMAKDLAIPVDVEVREPYARVKFSYGQTIQVRQFEPAKVSVEVDLPVNLDKIKEGAETCKNLVSEYITPEINELLNQKQQARRQ